MELKLTLKKKMDGPCLRRSRLRKKRLFLFSTALMMAACYSNKESNLETVKLLIDYGAGLNIQNNDGWTLC
jgi:hypothetical protein